MGRVEPNSKSTVSGTVALKLDSDGLVSSARTADSESVPVEVKGSLEPFLTIGFPFDLTDSAGVGDENKTGLGEGDGGLNYGVGNTILSQVGNRFGDTANLGLEDYPGVITEWDNPVNGGRTTPYHQYVHEGDLPVQQLHREILLVLEGQRLLAPYLGAGREDSGESLERYFPRFDGVRYHDVVHGDVRDIDPLGLELGAETGTVKTSTEDGSFVGVHMDHGHAVTNDGLHGLVNHGCFGGATGEDNRCDVRLQKEMSRRTTTNELETHEG